jgi:anti-sigma-K factor RskA
MTLEEFRQLGDTWGGDTERWPEASRAEARRLAVTVEASEILRRASRLDAVMSARPAVSPERARRASHAVLMRLAAGARRSEERPQRWSLPYWFIPAASVACSALIGISLAVSLPGAGDPEPIVLGMIIDSGSMTAGWTLR